MPKIKGVHLIAITALPISVALISAILLALRDRAPVPTTTETKKEVVAKPIESKEKIGKKKLAVTSDKFDAVGGMLDGLGAGYEYEVIEEAALRDPAALAEFQAVFLTCAEGDEAPDDPALSKSLRDFVAAGGTLYASDLRFDLVAAAFPEFVDRPSVAQGLRQELRASVVAPELKQVIGDEVKLHFWLDGWRPAAFKGDDARVLLKGRFQTTAGVSMEAPLLVKFSVGDGTVVFTSFHNETRNSGDEIKLMRYLTLKTVTAGLEARESAVLADDGYAPVAVAAVSSDPSGAPVSRVYSHQKAGPLRFRLAFEGARGEDASGCRLADRDEDDRARRIDLRDRRAQRRIGRVALHRRRRKRALRRVSVGPDRGCRQLLRCPAHREGEPRARQGSHWQRSVRGNLPE